MVYKIMDAHLVKNITPLPNLVLLAEFQDGSVKEYDVKPLLKELPIFQMLDYIPGLFNQVRVDVGCYGVVWNDEIDLSAEELYYNGK
ncbi:MAG: DUF2442 domain-containing protein [Synergistaceae bacterium]|nr:DUF2442 domain-containing protein [Synergistaceae bacterium]